MFPTLFKNQLIERMSFGSLQLSLRTELGTLWNVTAFTWPGVQEILFFKKAPHLWLLGGTLYNCFPVIHCFITSFDVVLQCLFQIFILIPGFNNHTLTHWIMGEILNLDMLLMYHNNYFIWRSCFFIETHDRKPDLAILC